MAIEFRATAAGADPHHQTRPVNERRPDADPNDNAPGSLAFAITSKLAAATEAMQLR